MRLQRVKIELIIYYIKRWIIIRSHAEDFIDKSSEQ